MNDFYTYAFVSDRGTPYYIGKGRGNRWHHKRKNSRCRRPNDFSKIIKLKENLTEEEALRHETYLIAVLGRVEEGGPLYNITAGGQGTSGYKHSETTRAKLKLAHTKRTCYNKGRKHSEETKQKLREARLNQKNLKGNQITINGTTYKTYKEAIKALGVARGTFYKRYVWK